MSVHAPVLVLRMSVGQGVRRMWGIDRGVRRMSGIDRGVRRMLLNVRVQDVLGRRDALVVVVAAGAVVVAVGVVATADPGKTSPRKAYGI
jgi:hypothetical protein